MEDFIHSVELLQMIANKDSKLLVKYIAQLIYSFTKNIGIYKYYKQVKSY